MLFLFRGDTDLKFALKAILVLASPFPLLFFLAALFNAWIFWSVLIFCVFVFVVIPVVAYYERRYKEKKRLAKEDAARRQAELEERNRPKPRLKRK